MSIPVTHQYLLEGAAHALEQRGLLLRDANILYRSGSYASAVVLAAFAREELGRSNILFDMRTQVLDGKVFTIKKIKKKCEDHVTKQREGMLSIVMRFDGIQSGLGKLVQARNEALRQSTERKSASKELTQGIKQKGKRIPTDRHEKRNSHSMLNRFLGVFGTGPQTRLLPMHENFCKTLSTITSCNITRATSRLRVQS